MNGSDPRGTCWTTNTTNTYLLVFNSIGGNGRCQSSDPLPAMSDHSYALLGGAGAALVSLKDYNVVADAIRIAAEYEAASGEIPVVLGEAGEGLTAAQATSDAATLAAEEAAVCPEAAAVGGAGGPAVAAVAVVLVAAGVLGIWAVAHWLGAQPSFDVGPQPLAAPEPAPTPGPSTQPAPQPTATPTRTGTGETGNPDKYIYRRTENPADAKVSVGLTDPIDIVTGLSFGLAPFPSRGGELCR